MRICLVTSARIPPIEGIGMHVHSLSCELTKRGHDVIIFSKGNNEKPTDVKMLGHCGALQPVPHPYLPPFHSDIYGFFVRRFLERLQRAPDILHIHSPLVPNISNHIPTISTFHSPMNSGVGKMEQADMRYVASKMMLIASSRRIEKSLAECSKLVTVVSDSVGREMRQRPYNVSTERIRVMGNGVDHRFFVPDDSRLQRKRIFWAGRLDSGKGLYDLANCAARVIPSDKEISFRVAGDGPLRRRLENLVARLEISERFKILGRLDRRQMLEEYQSAELFLLTSHYEGLPTTVLEAMACGTPCLSTSIGGVRDLIKDDENGFLVTVGDIASMAEKLLDILADPARIKGVSKEARNVIIKRFCWESLAVRYESVYEEVVGE